MSDLPPRMRKGIDENRAQNDREVIQRNELTQSINGIDIPKLIGMLFPRRQDDGDTEPEPTQQPQGAITDYSRTMEQQAERARPINDTGNGPMSGGGQGQSPSSVPRMTTQTQQALKESDKFTMEMGDQDFARFAQGTMAAIQSGDQETLAKIQQLSPNFVATMAKILSQR